MDTITERLRAAGTELCAEAADEIERLAARLVELEAAHAVTTGSLEWPPAAERDRFRIIQDMPPTTPR